MDNTKIIYHYTSEYTLLEHILPFMKLRFGTVKQFNDPYETVYKKSYIKSLKTHQFYESREILKSIVDIEMKFNDVYRNQLYIASFCLDSVLDNVNKVTFFENEFQYGYGKLRMWSQYANNHRGVCIALNKDKLIESIRKELVNSKYKIEHNKIEYLNQPVNYGALSIDYNEYVKNPEGYINNHIYEHIKELLFMKTRDWETENEYRVAIYSTENTDEFLFFNIKDSIEAIYLGIDFPMNYIEIVNKYFDNVYKLDLYNGDLRTDKVEITSLNTPFPSLR